MAKKKKPQAQHSMAFKDLSIRRKLILIILGTSVTTLLSASVTLGLYDRGRSLEGVQQHAHQLASLIATNATTPLVFRDPAATEDVLAGLDSQRDVRAVAIYDAAGRLFAKLRNPLAGPSSIPSQDQSFFTDHLYVVYRTVTLDGEQLGTVHVEIDLTSMNERTGNFIGLVAILIVTLTGVTWVVSTRLQQVLSKPVLELVEVAQEVSKNKDYSVRAKKRSADEIGLLVDSFNGMLSQIEDRDKQLRGEGDRLEAEVVARTRDLQEANARLEAATEEALATNRAQSQFIANMTHEIRTPMNGVLGMAELLFNTDLTPQQQKFTRTVLESAEDLLSIINNILDFSKVEAGKLEKVDSAPFSPRECVEKVAELLSSRAQPKRLALSHECTTDVPKALIGDGKRVRQVLTNIIGNAIKFTDHGSIVVRTSLVKTDAKKATIRFEVVDTGVGIPTHLHEHVFEGFSQADTSTTRQFGGTGLGLAISKHLVELMGGQISVISRPGVGSNFWFTVQGELWRTATADDRNLDGVRALLIATTHTNRDALRHQLTTFGATCVTVPNAERAREELSGTAASTFDVALIDTQALDWYALAREIRGANTTRSLPLVLVSTVARGDAELRDAGIDGSLTWPLQEKDLFSCLARVTGRLDVTVTAADSSQLEQDAWGTPGRRAFQSVDETGQAAIPELVPDEPSQDLRPVSARVLVAEDNLVNREVATAMLQTLACDVDVAEDGAQAIDAVRQKKYDLVFLDCQMPNLDGYGAAQQIRAQEASGKILVAETARTAGHLPLVALTAHTAPADRQRSLDSGMDDYVSKPFTLKQLQDVLERWVGTTPTFDEPLSSAPAIVDVSSDVNNATLSEVRALDRQTGGGLFARVLETYLDTAPELITQLHTAVEQKDAEGLARVAHDLKSASYNVGADALADVSRELEELGKRGDTGPTQPLAAQVDTLYAAVTVALRAQLKVGTDCPVPAT